MSKIHYIDIDGVLVDKDNNISEDITEFMKHTNDTITINTGRLMHDINFLKDKFKMKFDYKIALNGAHIQDSDNNDILKQQVPNDIAVEILKSVKKYKDIRIEVNTFENRYFYNERPADFPKEFVDKSIICKIDDYIENIEVAGFLIIFDPQKLDISILANSILEKYSEHVACVQTSPTSLEIFNAKASKGNAINFIEDNFISGNYKSYGYGDSESDISMANNVNISYSIGSKCSELVKASDFVVDSLEEALLNLNIGYLPLDERPCNFKYPKMIASNSKFINLITISKDMLGYKKEHAKFENIKEFLLNICTDVNYLVLSIDMLLYGGLIPSRIHDLEFEELLSRLEVIEILKEKNPKLKIFALGSIMRTPSYSSSDEEPDYYEEYGREIFRNKYLSDKELRDGLNSQEENELKEIDIPADIIIDYETRRNTNLKLTLELCKYLKKDLIDHLVIFQDDSSPYGYTNIDQNMVKRFIMDNRLNNSVDIYPGADEVGCTLIAKVKNDFYNFQPSFYVEYSSTLGEQIVPLYEDRPYNETLKSHIYEVNGYVTSDITNCDYVIMMNTPGKVAQEAFNQESRDNTYNSYRNLKSFTNSIKYYVKNNKKVIIADVAFTNGMDLELLDLLDSNDLLDKIYGYAGWNTNSNTIGTVISQAIYGKSIQNNLYHVLEDGFYQSYTRKYISENILDGLGLNYFDLKNSSKKVINNEKEILLDLYSKLKVSKKYKVTKLEIYHPWNRMFEIDLDVDFDGLH